MKIGDIVGNTSDMGLEELNQIFIPGRIFEELPALVDDDRMRRGAKILVLDWAKERDSGLSTGASQMWHYVRIWVMSSNDPTESNTIEEWHEAEFYTFKLIAESP